MFGLDHAGGAARLAVAEQGVGDVAGHPFLVGEAVADGVHEAGDAAKAVQAAAGQVGDVGDAAEGHQVVRADAVDGDAAHHDHVAARVGEAVTECGRRVEVVAAEQAALPEFAHALRGASHVRALGFDAAGVEQVANRALEGDGVEGAAARDADRVWRAGGVVLAAIDVVMDVVRGKTVVGGHGVLGWGWAAVHDTRGVGVEGRTNVCSAAMDFSRCETRRGKANER